MAEKAGAPLLVQQRNLTFTLIERAGFDPSDFKWDVVLPVQGGPTADRITHAASGYFFVFGMQRVGGSVFNAPRLSIYSPGADQGGNIASEAFDWDGQVRDFLNWLAALKAEVSTVSLWDTLGSGSARDLALARLPDRKLSRDQQADVAARAQQVRIYLRTNVEDRETLKRLEAKVDDLIESSKRLGVKDFAMTSLGVLLTIAWEAALDAHKAQEMVNLFTHGLRAVLGG